jgi:hypothetical protein
MCIRDSVLLDGCVEFVRIALAQSAQGVHRTGQTFVHAGTHGFQAASHIGPQRFAGPAAAGDFTLEDDFMQRQLPGFCQLD